MASIKTQNNCVNKKKLSPSLELIFLKGPQIKGLGADCAISATLTHTPINGKLRYKLFLERDG